MSAGHARRNLMFRPQRGAFRPRRSVNCDRVGQRLHMGEEGLTGMGADFPRDSAISRHRSRRADALPCAQTPLYAHGSTSTNFDGPGRTVESQRKPAASLLGSLSPMCEPPPGRGSSRPHPDAGEQRAQASPGPAALLMRSPSHAQSAGLGPSPAHCPTLRARADAARLASKRGPRAPRPGTGAAAIRARQSAARHRERLFSLKHRGSTQSVKTSRRSPSHAQRAFPHDGRTGCRILHSHALPGRPTATAPRESRRGSAVSRHGLDGAGR